MAYSKEWNMDEAIKFIRRNSLDWEDINELYEESTEDEEAEDKLHARLNTAYRVLGNAYNGYTIPNEATYLFASILSAVYNDTMVQAQRGVASFGIRGISFTFKDWAKKDLSQYITDEIDGIIQDANGEDGKKTRGVRVRYGVM